MKIKIALTLIALTSTLAFAEIEHCIISSNEVNIGRETITTICHDRKIILLAPNGSLTQLFDSTGKSLKETYCSCPEKKKQ